MKSNRRDPIFSIVIAVYNCEPFLRETLDSVVNQNTDGIFRYENGVPTAEPLSFEDLCEVIMVDDGSTDGSGAICDEYAERFQNFKAVHKENGGVASARNEGLLHVRGKYMNFLDSDDRFSDNVFREIYGFFETNYEKTDVVTMPLIFFDAFYGPHWQNYKFKQSAKVANLYNEFDSPLMFVNASFFKSEYKDKVRFNGKLVCGEDIRYICEILSEKMTMGLVPYCHYDYRRRSAGEESLVQTSKKKVGWYFDYFEHLTEWGVDFCMKKWGYIPHYYQNILMCDLQWRFLGNYETTAKTVLGEEDYERYKARLFSVMKHFDDEMILRQKNVYNEHKCMMLSKKYGTAPERCVYGDDVRLRFGNTLFCWLSSCYTLINVIKIENQRLIIEGYTTLLGCNEKDSVELFLEVNEEGKEPRRIPCSTIENRDVTKLALDETLFPAFAFLGEADLYDIEKAKINLACFLNGDRIVKKDLRLGRFAPLSKNYASSYYAKDGFAVKLCGYTFSVTRCGGALRGKLECAFLRELLKSKKSSDKKAFFALVLRKLLKPFTKKRIWLISDREAAAGDNGEALFGYLAKNTPKNVKPMFVINGDCPDAERIAKVGKILPLGSYRHKINYLLADMLLMSHTDDPIILPFKEYSAPYQSIIAEKKNVFLQHGVTLNDVSRWFNKYTVNARGFVTSSERERESILKGKYCYGEDQVWLTGMPRFDKLKNERKKIIAVVPTWRAYLLANNAKDGISDSKFMSSDYFKFYERLFTDERLKAVLERNGYEMLLKPHFRMTPYLELFKGGSVFKTFAEDTDYTTIFSESALLLTDYSSVSFDFAYLRKPVIYAQFDKEEFFSGIHTYTPGYFDYSRDGFGEVTEDYDTTVNALIDYIESDCALKECYRNRIDGFFAFSDRENSKRLTEKLKML